MLEKYLLYFFFEILRYNFDATAVDDVIISSEPSEGGRTIIIDQIVCNDFFSQIRGLYSKAAAAVNRIYIFLSV